MKVKVLSPWVDKKGLHCKGEVVEIETAAFDPIIMAEIAEKKVAKTPAVVKAEEASKAPAAKKTTAKKTTTKKKG